MPAFRITLRWESSLHTGKDIVAGPDRKVASTLHFGYPTVSPHKGLRHHSGTAAQSNKGCNSFLAMINHRQTPELTNADLRILLETGFILREAARFEEAAAVFDGCAHLMPDSEVPLVGLGTVYLQKGEYESALSVCAEALDRNRSSAYARLHLGEALLLNGRQDEAKRHLGQLILDEDGSTFADTAARIIKLAGL